MAKVHCAGGGLQAQHTPCASAAVCASLPPPPTQRVLVIVIHKQHVSGRGRTCSKERHSVICYLDLICVRKVRFRPDNIPLQMMLKV